MKFFVSYSRSVKQDVGQVVALLRAAGNDVWWDGDIPIIADWWATILENIEACEVFIFVVSEKAVQSAYCLAELEYATKRNRPILPFIVDDHTRYVVPPEVTPMRNQWFVHDGDPARMLQRIVEATGKVQWDKYRDLPAARPIEPNTGSGSLIKQFQQAVSLAEDGRFEEAIKRFHNVASIDHAKWGQRCHQWIVRLRLYSDIVELAGHKGTLQDARDEWESYLKNYDGEFDPLNVRNKINTPLPTPVVVVPHRSYVRETMPAPFAWCEIPAGEVTLIENYAEKSYFGKKGESKTFQVPAFAIAKYPVTNTQFRKFVDGAKGYSQKKWWTDEGWQVREREKWTKPHHWDGEQGNGDEYPVVGLSWYEAIAFCQWLSDAAGEKVMLPTEQQWQRAAQALPDGGDSRYAYPWGTAWDVNKCNNSVGKGSHKNRTSPVTEYEGKGDSACGVVDMSGNVWEWCLTKFETGGVELDGKDVRVLRGGSSGSTDRDFLRSDCRLKLDADSKPFDSGFRIALS